MPQTRKCVPNGPGILTGNENFHGSECATVEFVAPQPVAQGSVGKRRRVPLEVDIAAEDSGISPIDGRATQKTALAVATPRSEPIEPGGGYCDVHGKNCIWS